MRKILSTLPLFQWKYLTIKLLAELYGIEESTVKNYLKSEIGWANGHPKMFWEDYIKSHNEWWGHGNLIVISPDEAIRFYLKFSDKIGRKFDNNATTNRYFIESSPATSQTIQQPVVERVIEAPAQQTYAPPIQQHNQDDIIAQMRTMFDELKKNNQVGENSILIEELRKQIEKIEKQLEEEKKEKREVGERFELEKKELQEKLFEESKRVEKVYFVSDRYDKMNLARRQFLQDFAVFVKGLSNGEQKGIGNIKRLLLSQNINERVDITSEGDINFQTLTNDDIFKDIESIPDDTIIERSREAELLKMRKAKITWMILGTISLLLAITLVVLRLIKIY